MSKKITYIKTSSVNKKFLQLFVAVVLLIVSLNIWLGISVSGKQLITENTDVLADNILQQTSHTAAAYIQTDNIGGLDILAASALKSPYIHEMIIYDARGIVLSKSENAITTKDRFLTEDEQLAKANPIPFVQEVRSEDGVLLGFTRITVLGNELQQQGTLFVHTILKEILLLALFAGVIGYLFTIGLRPFSANAFILKE